EEERRLMAQQKRNKNSGANLGSGSKWYFYNQKVSSNGFNEFRVNWGQRKLEDDWRRSTKTSFTFDTEDPEAIDSLQLTMGSEDSLTVDMLKADLPLTPEAMDSSNNRLMNSLYMLGIIYKEQLKQQNEAIKYFKMLENRGVEHPKVLPAIYQLYLIYNKKGAPEAKGYKDLILKKYPGSEIAEMLEDPDYLEKKREKELADLNAYSKTLENYRYQRYPKVLAQCNEIIENDSTNQYLYKYYLLKAFSIGKSNPGNSNRIKEPLQELYNLAPNSEEGKEAKLYLDRLAKGYTIVQPDTNKNNTVVSPYIYDEEMEHYFVLVFPSDAGKINATEYKVGNFNKEFFKSSRLTVKSFEFNGGQLLVVRVFPKQLDAQDYLQAFNHPTARTTLGKTAETYDHFIINSANFQELIKSSDLTGYLDFFKEKYPQ
ncbi:MAG: hypothetical protein HUJ25_06455, partial [Crocinitomicaceae bacterium]|nr:hypothetical protein [Crocinitomicaceae bacterium]